MISSYSRLITANCPRLQLCRLIRAEYSSLCTNLFEDIVIVMIMSDNIIRFHFVFCFLFASL